MASQNESPRIHGEAPGIIGKGFDRVDGVQKVTGAARYSADIAAAGTLHAVLIMSTIGRGQIRSMDTREAEAEPGVHLVMTPFNAPRVNAVPPPAAPGHPPGRVLSLLQKRDVWYNNQPIGLVVADTLEAAAHGASLVTVRYDVQTPVTTVDPSRAYKPEKANRETTDSLRGDPESALKAAPKRVREVYRTPVENHNPMEPHATLAVWEGDRLTVYDATQGIFGVRDTLATILEVPKENVRCISHFLGGGFGCKGSVWSHVPLAAMAARQLGRPVKLVLTREHMFGMVGYRPVTEQTIALGATPAGVLTSLRHDTVSQTSTFDEFVEPSGVASRMLYACPNAATTHRVVRINYGTPTFMRAPGESSGTFAIETAMDEMACALGMDPVEFRLKNYTGHDPGKNRPFSSKSLRECYAVAAREFDWNRRNPRPGALHLPSGLRMGLGMATATYPTNRSASSAMARLMADGSAYVEAGSQDLGTGTYTVMTQVAAAALGVPFEKVRFELGDTEYPQTPGSGGSQTAASTGSAVHEASRAVRKKAIQLALADAQSPLHGLPEDQVETADGRLFSRAHPSVGESFSALLTRNHLPQLEATYQWKPGQEQEIYSMHSFGAVFTEVHVDTELGSVRVARIVGAYGVGRRLNAKTARSQLMGGIVMGMGMALMEHTLVDPRTARVVNPDLAEYHVPVNADVPRVDIHFVNEEDPHVNPLGIKGVGELGITGLVASITNAVYHATGRRVRDLPITADKVML